MRVTLAAVVLLILAVGCAQPERGYVIVNHSPHDLRNVTISSGDDREIQSWHMGILPPGGSFSSDGMGGPLKDRSVAEWTSADDRTHRQELVTKVPRSFRGYIAFEHQAGMWTFSTVTPAAAQQLVRPPRKQ